MSRGKKKKFSEIKNFPNVLEWNSNGFNEKVKGILNKYDSCIVELGCGKGEYSLFLGKENPATLLLGIDIQGERVWKGAKEALESNLKNVFFLRMQIENVLTTFPKKSIDEIWITFPDPFPKDRDSKKRLTSSRFLSMYKEILKEKGVIHLKTDSNQLYKYSKESAQEAGFKILKAVTDIYKECDNMNSEVVLVQTDFEKRYIEKGESIKYLKMTF